MGDAVADEQDDDSAEDYGVHRAVPGREVDDRNSAGDRDARSGCGERLAERLHS
jgi:hypothetical protein